MSEPLVEVLTFAGCPHARGALELVDRVLADTGIPATVRHVDVPDSDAAAAQRFLGSPTIRVDGRDIEPDAEERGEFTLSCRVYRTAHGVRGEPDERWLREALTRR
jgi:hypothetical protein